MTIFNTGKCAVFGLGALLASTAVVQAQTAEEFYTGKTVTMVVAAAPGGFADTIARTFVTKFAQHFPGKPEFIVVNKPGAGGIVAAAQLQNTEAKDGTTIGFLLGNVLTTPLVTGQTAQFDPHNVQWIGSIRNGDYPYALYAKTDSDIQSAQDLFDKTLVVGSTSFTNYNRVFPALMNEYIGTQMDIVAGYQGSGEVYLALERDEVSGWMEGSHAILNKTNKAGQMIDEGTLKPIMLMAKETDERWPDLPILEDYITDENQRAVANFLMTSSASGRPIAVPAEVPAERVEAIRAAFDETFADPEFVPYMQEMLSTPVVLSLSDDDLNGMINDFYAASEETLEKVRGFMVD
ncbi:Tripartite tricarboxylate transporter family receptor [Aquimixticola soesokkakensis]|uniref:Tripartite tricarboxylate transporter family receptor n=1 Tax=Aquimixticola soesokkakensis TaxID=1519096 RepID=A0A1Y5RQY5_9RHOB|nr:tripartite tricarboxylate transporter substrate-binding protein [Aquimixticola soesokkakensis]SLN22896.1 Tripartite tricarboxylate transporter family receptor [Aquimixticola soesokkakensis]